MNFFCKYLWHSWSRWREGELYFIRECRKCFCTQFKDKPTATKQVKGKIKKWRN